MWKDMSGHGGVFMFFITKPDYKDDFTVDMVPWANCPPLFGIRRYLYGAFGVRSTALKNRGWFGNTYLLINLNKSFAFSASSVFKILYSSRAAPLSPATE